MKKIADKSAIEWTDATWNHTGCIKISHGVSNCDAERLALPLREMGNSRNQNGFGIILHRNMLPLRWTKPKMIFVNSMIDLFHEFGEKWKLQWQLFSEEISFTRRWL
jgi:protein gp37